MSDEPAAPDDLFERLLDLAVYAPVGFALTVRDELPAKVRQGRQAMENRVQLARFIGQLAVQTGRRELGRRLEERRAANAAGGTGAGVPGDAGSVVAEPDRSTDDTRTDDTRTEDTRTEDTRTEDTAARTVPTGPVVDVEVPAAGDLPIAEYESLAAIHVVDRLRTMQRDELELVRRFEVAHRNRRTILAKIEQLQQR
ncbi:MAG: hypothetical protein F2534_15440 [Actinobacteria bacterium]|uniref:Unannotated protein n=1 Tax=freshwater metagenome TaxID=449393 RepID=A0A6J6ET39_9ZZZZ|nr:hypothetical protein [Actinomycetota bacterium]